MYKANIIGQQKWNTARGVKLLGQTLGTLLILNMSQQRLENHITR